MDDIFPPVFLVISGTTAPQAALGERETALLRRLGALRVVLRASDAGAHAPGQDVITLSAKDDLFASWLVETGAMAAVIRPDRYVYGVAGTASQLTQLIRSLEDALFA